MLDHPDCHKEYPVLTVGVVPLTVITTQVVFPLDPFQYATTHLFVVNSHASHVMFAEVASISTGVFVVIVVVETVKTCTYKSPSESFW